METSRTARSISPVIPISSASAPSPASATTARSALRVQHQLQPAADQLVIIGEQDSGRERYRHQRPLDRQSQRHLRALTWAGLDVKRPAPEQRPLSHALDADRFRACVRRGHADPVVAHAQLDLTVAAFEHDQALRCLRVAEDVRERLLSHSVDHELELGRHRRELGREPALDSDSALAIGARRQRDQGVDQTEVVERFGPKVAGDPSDLVEACVQLPRDRGHPLALRRGAVARRLARPPRRSRSAFGRPRRAAPERCAGAPAPGPSGRRGRRPVVHRLGDRPLR